MLRTTLFSAAAALLCSVVQAQLKPVTDWIDANPTNLKLDIYVPPQLAESPAILLALHPCGGSGPIYYKDARYQAYADRGKFILAFPSATNDSNCWDVSSPRALRHGGGGDSTTVNSMIQHLIRKYNADAGRVYVTGTSSGCMMTNVMMATYPNVFAAGSCYSGVAAGCVAGSFGNALLTSNRSCANGEVVKTGAEWAAQVHAMFPNYTGKYPRMQTFHGTADNLVYPVNLDEQLKEWSALLNVTPSHNVTDMPQRGWTQLNYGDGTQLVGYMVANFGHTIPVRPEMDVAWFGLMTPREKVVGPLAPRERVLEPLD